MDQRRTGGVLKMGNILINIDDELHNELKISAIRHNLLLRDFIKIVVQDGLEAVNSKNKKVKNDGNKNR